MTSAKISVLRAFHFMVDHGPPVLSGEIKCKSAEVHILVKTTMTLLGCQFALYASCQMDVDHRVVIARQTFLRDALLHNRKADHASKIQRYKETVQAQLSWNCGNWQLTKTCLSEMRQAERSMLRFMMAAKRPDHKALNEYLRQEARKARNKFITMGGTLIEKIVLGKNHHHVGNPLEKKKSQATAQTWAAWNHMNEV